MVDSRTFSVRNDINPGPPPKAEDAPEELRFWLFQYLKGEFPNSPFEAADLIGNYLRNPRFAAAFSIADTISAWQRLYGQIREFEWWRIYDLMEHIYKAIPYGRRQFATMVNNQLTAEESCYRMNERGQVVYVGADATAESINHADAALGARGKYPAKNEIHRALAALSKRPDADLPGALQHAMAGLEIATRVLSEKEGMSFEEIVKKSEKFPAPLGEAVNLLHKFVLERGKRPAGVKTTYEETELVISIAATVATYIYR